MRGSIVATMIATALTLAPPARCEPRHDRDVMAVAVDGMLGDRRMALALRTGEGSWPDAAVALRARARRTPSATERAELDYRLGIALYESKLYCSSRSVFERIANDPGNPAFRRTLGWIARLAEHLPEPAGLSKLVRKYSDADAATLRDAKHLPLFWTQAYLRGLEAARLRRRGEAVRLFRMVDPRSAHYVQARLAAAQTQLEAREPTGALWTLAELLHSRAVWRADTYAPDRIEDLAHLTMARILYSEAVHRERDGSISVTDIRKLRAALRHYSQVGHGDPRRRTAREGALESAWMRFLLGDRRGAARGVQRLAWGWLSEGDAVSEQALLFELRLRREHGDSGSERLARALVRQVAQRRRGIQRMIHDYGGEDSDAELVTRALEIVEGVSRLDTALRHSLEERVLLPRVLRAMNYVRVVEYEIARLDRMSEAFRHSPLYGELQDVLARTWQRAVRVAARRTRRRLRSAAAELDDVARRAAPLARR